MKLKGFGELPSDIEVVKGVENTEVGTEQAVTAEVTMAPQPKIDRRAKLLAEMNDEELFKKAYKAVLVDPEARNAIIKNVNTSLKTEFVVSEAKREREEQDAKWEEVERVEAKIRAEREETARRTAQVLREAEEARRKETEEQDRKWEEVSRVREELEKERAEMSARTAAVIAAAKQKNSEWETPDGPRDVAA